MKKKTTILALIFSLSSTVVFFSFNTTEKNEYINEYILHVNSFIQSEKEILFSLRNRNLTNEQGITAVQQQIHASRMKLKSIDFWLRYFDPVQYNKINAPIPVEWEAELFEKNERPRKRTGAGLSLAELTLDEKDFSKEKVIELIQTSIDSMAAFKSGAIVEQLKKPDCFFFSNRLYLLNLAAIYTTGLECPDKNQIIPELVSMLAEVKAIYSIFNKSFPSYQLKKEYLDLYDKAIQFTEAQPKNIDTFDHFTFIKDYVNPLFGINQKMILQYHVVSKNMNDVTLNNGCKSIFDKSLYEAQNTKGIFWAVDDPKLLAEIRATGKLFFYDPILSGNDKRSCASCHHPKEYFTDTTVTTNLKFDSVHTLPRNTPSLINVIYHHLLMLDGKHPALLNQAKDVTTNPEEMAGSQYETLKKILSCPDYEKSLKKFATHTPVHPTVEIEHVLSSVIFYYSSFSYYSSSFDAAMNRKETLSAEAIKGFNLFMGKAQCGTCHYVPMFNGVKPPFLENEFEAIGVPEDTSFKNISSDYGRYKILAAPEMLSAFRTPTLRNASHTKSYLHNGVFNSLEEVVDFYDAGGGAGKGMQPANQTLSKDSLKLSPEEKKSIVTFIHALDEHIRFEEPPVHLPASTNKELNSRKVGGNY